jgi:hypothetical protein
MTPFRLASEKVLSSDQEGRRVIPKETVRKVVAGLVIVLIVQCLFTLSLVSALHDPVPHNLPFGVTGPSPLVTQVKSQLSLKTIQYPNESAVREAIDQNKIYGALLPGSGSDTLIVVPAASFIIWTYVEPTFVGVARKLHTPLTVQVSHPLPASDPTGAVTGLLLLPLLIGGYLASVLITKATGAATAPWRVEVLVVYAFLGGLLTDLIAGPILDAYAGHFWILWPIFALIIAAVALAASVLQRAIGALGTLVVVILFVVLGGASSGGGGVPVLPEFWRDIGPYLPPRNAVTVIRNTLYFDGNGTTQSYIVLGLYALVGAAVSAFLGWFRTPQGTAGARPSAAAGPPAATGVSPAEANPGAGRIAAARLTAAGRKVIVGAVLLVLVVQALFSVNYMSSGHKPVAHDLPFGQSGDSPLTAQVEKQLSLKTTQYPNESAVHDALDQGKIYGGLVAGSDSDTLFVNASASALAPLPLAVNFERAAKQENRTLEVKASNKPPSGDPFAVVPALILIPLLIGGYVASTMLMTATGTATGPWRVAILVGFAFVAALLVDLISGAFVWGWPIHQFWVLWPILALVIAAVALVASVLQKLLGAAGTLLTIIVMIQFGNPSSGGPNGVPFLPAFWRDIGPFLPPRNALTAIHQTMYFDGHGMTQALVVLGLYAVVFGVLSSFLGWYRTPKEPVTPETQLEAASVTVAGTGVA